GARGSPSSCQQARGHVRSPGLLLRVTRMSRRRPSADRRSPRLGVSAAAAVSASRDALRAAWWRRPSVLAALLLGAASLAAAASLHGRRRAPAGITRQEGLDVLLVTIDTLRADAVGSYGARTGAT